jgi:hypothetical protein
MNNNNNKEKKKKKKKMMKHRLLLFQLIGGNEAGGTAVWNPSRIERAKQELKAKEDQELAVEAAKATKLELQH